jgi:hypothetical protein
VSKAKGRKELPFPKRHFNGHTTPSLTTRHKWHCKLINRMAALPLVGQLLDVQTCARRSPIDLLLHEWSFAHDFQHGRPRSARPLVGEWLVHASQHRVEGFEIPGPYVQTQRKPSRAAVGAPSPGRVAPHWQGPGATGTPGCQNF